MSPPQNTLDLARQGNLGAIAFLLSQRLQPHGLQVRVARRGESLCILLEGKALPEQSAVVAYLRRYLEALNLPLGSVQVYGRLLQSRYPVWVDSFTLPAIAPPTTDSSPAVAVTPSAPCSAPRLWLQWQAATLRGVALVLLIVVGIGSLLASILQARLTTSPGGLALLAALALLGILLYGLLVGNAQAHYLRAWLPQAHRWRRATALGMSLGMLIAAGLQGIGGVIGLALTARPLPTLGLSVGAVVLGAIALGLILGGLQWQVLQPQVANARRWIWATLAGSLLGSVLGWGGGGILFYSLARSLHLADMTLSLATRQEVTILAQVIGLSALFGTVMNWCVFQALTATTLVGLLLHISNEPGQ